MLSVILFRLYGSTMPPKVREPSHDSELTLARQVVQLNFHPLVMEQVKTFLLSGTCVSVEQVTSQEEINRFKRAQVMDMIMKFMQSKCHQGTCSVTPIVGELLPFLLQFSERGITSPTKVEGMLEKISLPENADNDTAVLFAILTLLLHYLGEWKRIECVKRRLPEAIVRDSDVEEWCKMIFAVEDCRKDIKTMLKDTKRCPRARLCEIKALEKTFHEHHLQSHALSRWQQQIGCYIPSPSEIELLVEHIRTHGITHVVDPFCGHALVLAILGMFIDLPMYGCDTNLSDKTFVQFVVNDDAPQFVAKLLAKSPKDVIIMEILSWPPSDHHLMTGPQAKRHPTDMSPQAQLLQIADPRLRLVAMISDLPDPLVNPCDPSSTVIGSTDGEAVLSDVTKYSPLVQVPVSHMVSKDYSLCTPVHVFLRIFQSVHP